MGPGRREAPAKKDVEEEEDKERPLNAVARLKVIAIEAVAMGSEVVETIKATQRTTGK